MYIFKMQTHFWLFRTALSRVSLFEGRDPRVQ